MVAGQRSTVTGERLYPISVLSASCAGGQKMRLPCKRRYDPSKRYDPVSTTTRVVAKIRQSGDRGADRGLAARCRCTHRLKEAWVAVNSAARQVWLGFCSSTRGRDVKLDSHSREHRVRRRSVANNLHACMTYVSSTGLPEAPCGKLEATACVRQLTKGANRARIGLRSYYRPQEAV